MSKPPDLAVPCRYWQGLLRGREPPSEPGTKRMICTTSRDLIVEVLSGTRIVQSVGGENLEVYKAGFLIRLEGSEPEMWLVAGQAP